MATNGDPQIGFVWPKPQSEIVIYLLYNQYEQDRAIHSFAAPGRAVK
jgi:hypothetical protein